MKGDETYMVGSMLSTVDNPYDPFKHFDDWLAFDESKGYFTCEYLGRIAKTSNELSDEEQGEEIEAAIDEIVKENILGIYKKVKRNNAAESLN